MDIYDFIVVGAGAGGSVFAFSVAKRGYKVLVVERGTSIPSEPANSDPKRILSE